jgi:hypothetical protein
MDETAITLFFAGDVMTGRGVDQILARPSPLALDIAPLQIRHIRLNRGSAADARWLADKMNEISRAFWYPRDSDRTRRVALEGQRCRVTFMCEILPGLGENSRWVGIDPFSGSNRAARHLLVDWKWCTNRATGGKT